MRLIRVFPRKTNMTPTDDLAIVDRFPGFFDEADRVHVSVAFQNDIPRAEKLAEAWKHVAPVEVDGPAYGNPGGEFQPGLYVAHGRTITSRGCPNRCWYCVAWKNEGNTIRELEVIHDGWNLLDNNILACSKEHQTKVFEMLSRQDKPPLFTGGLEAELFTEWHAEWLLKLKPPRFFFAYDLPEDYEPLVQVSKILKDYNIIKPTSHAAECYVLIGYPKDTLADAEKRLMDVMKLGIMPYAMLYNEAKHFKKQHVVNEWVALRRQWCNFVILGRRMYEYERNKGEQNES